MHFVTEVQLHQAQLTLTVGNCPVWAPECNVLLIMAALCNRGPLYFCPVISIVYRLSFFSSPNLSGHRLDLYHTSTHGVALVRI